MLRAVEQPTIEAIHVAPRAGAPMQSLEQIEAVAGEGLTADRYLSGAGFYSRRPTSPGARQVTLFEAEVLERLLSEHGIVLSAGQHRRNLTTRGVRLAELLGQRFRVGDALLEGVKDCPPCEHLERLVDLPVMRPLVNSGGLRARILEGGTIRVGDSIVAEARTVTNVGSV